MASCGSLTAVSGLQFLRLYSVQLGSPTASHRILRLLNPMAFWAISRGARLQLMGRAAMPRWLSPSFRCEAPLVLQEHGKLFAALLFTLHHYSTSICRLHSEKLGASHRIITLLSPRSFSARHRCMIPWLVTRVEQNSLKVVVLQHQPL